MVSSTAVAPLPTRSVWKKAWVITGMLTIFMVLNFADKAVLGLVAKPAMAELNISPVQFGFIGSSFFFLFSLSAIVVGIFAERISSRWMLAVMAVVWALAQFPVQFGGGAIVLLLCRIVLGAGEGPALPMALHTCHNWFPAHDRPLPSNIIAVGATLGAVVAAPLLSLVIEAPALGWRWAFGLLGAASLVWAIGWILISRDGPYRASGTVDEGGHVPPSSTEELDVVPVRTVFSSAMWLVAGLAGFACFWAQAVLTTWVPRYIGGVLAIGESWIGLVFALPWLAGTMLLLVLGVIGRRIMRSGRSAHLAVGVLFGASLVLSGLCIVGLTHATGALAIVLLTVGWGAFLVFPMAPTAVAYAVHPKQRAVLISTLIGLASVGGVISPTVVGAFVGRAGYATAGGQHARLAAGLNAAFTLTGVILIGTGLAAAVLLNPERTAAKLQQRRRPNGA